MSLRIVKGFSAEMVHFSVSLTKKELADQKIGLDGILRFLLIHGRC